MIFISPNVAKAENGDLYADLIYSASNQVYKPTNALGAPDSAFSDFFDKDATFTLDMGEGEESAGDLTLTYKIFNLGAAYRVEFKDSDLNKTQTSSNTLPLGATETTITYTSETPYRYVTITSVEEETWSLDAITTASIIEIEAPAEPEDTSTEVPPVDTTEEVEAPTCGGNQGLVVKRPNDGNAETNSDSIVYTIGCDNTLHIFPDEQTYKTWWPDFESLAYIDGTFISQHALGNRVTIRPGTWLVKKASEPKVYAVEPNGVLRWIPDETTAVELYGPNWNKIIIDVPEKFFSDYIISENLTATAYPDGVIGYLPVEGRVVYLTDTIFYNLPGDIINSLRLNTNKFLVPLSAKIMATYTDGGDLVYDTETAFPF